MNYRIEYAINVYAVFAKCLLKWRQVCAFALVAGAIFAGIEYITFEVPAEDCMNYRRIEAAIVERTQTKIAFEAAQADFNEDDLQVMDDEYIEIQRSNLNDLQKNLKTCNASLGSLLGMEGGSVAVMTETELYDRFEQKKLAESKPNLVKRFVYGGFCGALFIAIYLCLPDILQRKLLGENTIAEVTGWRYIGRTFGLKRTRDPLMKLGQCFMYRNYQALEYELQNEVIGLINILLNANDIRGSRRICLIGELPDALLKKCSSVLSEVSVDICPISPYNRVIAEQLCREVDAVVFVGVMNQVTMNDIHAVQEILVPLGKTPLGYVLM